MKNILCFGDSNTWGTDPATWTRYAPDHRWPLVMGKRLGDDYCVFEDGVGGRSSVWDNPYTEGLNGLKSLPYSLLRARPIDLMIIMLGANDLNYADAVNSARGIRSIICKARGICAETGSVLPIFKDMNPKFLIVSPAELNDNYKNWRHTVEPFFNVEESRKFAKAQKEIAELEGAAFLNGSLYAKAGKDGLHIDAESQIRLGNAIADKIVKEHLC